MMEDISDAVDIAFDGFGGGVVCFDHYTTDPDEIIVDVRLNLGMIRYKRITRHVLLKITADEISVYDSPATNANPVSCEVVRIAVKTYLDHERRWDYLWLDAFGKKR